MEGEITLRNWYEKKAWLTGRGAFSGTTPALCFVLLASCVQNELLDYMFSVKRETGEISA